MGFSTAHTLTCRSRKNTIVNNKPSWQCVMSQHTQHQDSLNTKWTSAKINFITSTFVWCLGETLVKWLALSLQEVSGCDPDVRHAGYLCQPCDRPPRTHTTSRPVTAGNRLQPPHDPLEDEWCSQCMNGHVKILLQQRSFTFSQVTRFKKIYIIKQIMLKKQLLAN